MYDPFLTSSIDALSSPSTRALSASLIFTSWPSRVFTDSTLPATCSMVPRTRTRSCANALVATIANPIAVTPTAHRVISLMVVLPNRHGAPVHSDQPAGRLIIPLIRVVASAHPGSEGGEAE